MKKILIPLIAACTAFGLYSCYGGCGKSPQFSPETLSFDANGGSGVISGTGTSWDIELIVVDNHSYRYECGQAGDSSCLLTVYCDSVYNADDYHNQYPFERVSKFEGTWFSTTVKYDAYRNPQSLLFSVQPNETGKSRKLQINIGAHCSEHTLTVTQSAE